MATNVDAKLLKQTKFPPEFSQKVDMKKVNVEVMKKWIAGKISEILGSEDDVVVELCFNLLEGSRFPDIKVLQIQLTGFLDKDTPKFCKELWTLCLSAQSNPQGVPKELLEAKKLELIQEKIDAEKAAEEAQRSEPREVAVVEGGICDIMNTIGVYLDTPDLLHHGGDNRQIDGDKIGVPNHHPFDDLLVDPCPAQERRLQGVTEMITQGLDVAVTVLADPELLFVVVVEETEGRETITVAVIELDPIHLQIRLAHIHPEDREGDAALQYHPAVILLQQAQNITNMAVLCYHRHLYQGLALAQSNEIAGGLADREDLRPVVVMKCMLHALMLVKDEATTAVGIGAAVAIAVNTRSARLRRKLQTEIPAYRGSGKGRGVGPWKDMHLLREDGVTPLQCLHPLRSDTKQLILLKRKRIGHPLNPSAEALKTNRLLSGGTKRLPTQTANELREKLLREKVLAIRKTSTSIKK
ncbi:MAG: hypothetical protein Q9171_002637 [Xanthocarpia ochracea]